MTPENYAEFIYKSASLYAEAKSNRIGKELAVKITKGILMKHAQKNGVTQLSAQERDAIADEDFLISIKELQEAVKIEEELKYKIEAAKLSIDIWRTREASERLAIRSHE